MSVTCEICGKEFKTTQGLRGHKTFVHDIHADRGKQADGFQYDKQEDKTARDNRIKDKYFDEPRGKLDKMERVVSGNIELANELRRAVNKLQEQLTVQNQELSIISHEVDSLRQKVNKHEEWFNPHDIHEVIIGLCGGPIADIEKRLRNKQFK